LARAVRDPSPAGSTDLVMSLSAPGLVGTPAYMAPEQFDGGEITPATDQFAFCIALWETLIGERPFAGSDLATLRDAVVHGRRRDIPRAVRMPGYVARALQRGLSQ